jgi:hypothetical protein
MLRARNVTVRGRSAQFALAMPMAKRRLRPT